MVQQAGRKGVFVGRRRWTDGRHFRPLTMFEGIAAKPAVPFNVSAADPHGNRPLKVCGLAEMLCLFAGATELLFGSLV
jgi:hypothetical protein